MNGRSLVQRARQFNARPGPVPPTEEQVELACAWARGDVTLGAVEHVIQRKGHSAYLLLARSLRDAVRSGRLAEPTNGHAAGEWE
jgi:hypothetical protein